MDSYVYSVAMQAVLHITHRPTQYPDHIVKDAEKTLVALLLHAKKSALGEYKPYLPPTA
jgi:hypothetical protein